MSARLEAVKIAALFAAQRWRLRVFFGDFEGCSRPSGPILLVAPGSDYCFSSITRISGNGVRLCATLGRIVSQRLPVQGRAIPTAQQ